MDADIIKVHEHLFSLDLLRNSPKYWWPSAGSFEVVVGAVLTQNTTWKNVERSLSNLQNHLTLETFLHLGEEKLKELIRPSGFYNQKAPRLLALARNIHETFCSFENFQKRVTREWLLAQKGIGKESADAILCYGCKRAAMVVDTYTKRTLREFGIELRNYDEYKELIEGQVEKHWEELSALYENDLHLFYCRFHGMFVEYQKYKKTKR